MTTKSVELMQLETALSDLTKHITGLERKVYKEEEEYVRTSIARGSDTSAPQFGNLISGWEGILEGTRVDTNKGREKIYSQSSATWREYQEARNQERERQQQDAQALAMKTAIREAEQNGATGAEAQELGQAAAAAAAAAFKANKLKLKKSGKGGGGGGGGQQRPKADED